MKSAIFQESRGPGEHRSLKKPLLKKKGRSQSPFIASAGTPHPNWNLEEMISSYISSGVLPALLSPHLPARFEVKTEDKREISDTEARDNESMDESDIESIPMSLLSPTLPNIFNEGKSFAALAHPMPKKANELSMVLESKSKTKRVRWVDKTGSEKPRFLLRITLDRLLEKYKNTFLSRAPEIAVLKSPLKSLSKLSQVPSNTSLQGLAIFESRKIRDADEHTKSEREPRSKGSPRRDSSVTENGSTKEDVQRISKEDVQKNPWSQIARDLKLKYERIASKDILFSIVLQLDYLLCLAMLCDVDDSRRMAKDNTPTEGNWQNLHSDIILFVGRLERYIKSNNLSDKRKAFFSFIVAILAMKKATILKRVNQNLERTVKSLAVDKDASPELRKVIELQKQIIRNHQKKDDHCKEAQSFFAKCPSTSTVFPKSWNRRVPNSPRPAGVYMSPATDSYHLPLGPYSDLRETCAFLYSCVREFCEIYSYDINGGASYAFCSGQKHNVDE